MADQIVKLQIPGGKAAPAPPVGTALGPHGVDMQGFCNRFNEQTKDQIGVILPVVITIHEDRSLDFIVKQPPVAELLKKELGIAKGSGEPNKNKVAKLTRAQAEKVAEAKMPDLNANDIDAAVKIVAGQARSMGIDYEG